MKLIEADGKQLLRDAGIQPPPGVFLSMEATEWPANTPWPGAVFVKSQVLQGRRGASGLILPCASAEELPSILTTLKERIGNRPCAGFLCESAVQIMKEWFVALDMDRTTGVIRASVSQSGGMNVASATTDVSSFPSSIRQTISQLTDAFVRMDAAHLEINPLAETTNGQLIALDAKIELDDAAAFRHPEWALFHLLPAFGRALTEREQQYATFLSEAGHRGTFGRYLELDGDTALILSGGGASLLALDALQRAGGRAANYLEVSGNPEPEKLREAARIALSKPGITGLWVAGSFANFTDIQATCRAILQAVTETGLKIPVVIRRDGPNVDAAEQESRAWADVNGVSLAFHRADTSLEDSARALLASRV